MAVYNKMKNCTNIKLLSTSYLQAISIPPEIKTLSTFQASSTSIPPESKPTSFASIATPKFQVIPELIPKLRNMKIELEFTLTEACSHQDLIDLKREHIRKTCHLSSARYKVLV